MNREVRQGLDEIHLSQEGDYTNNSSSKNKEQENNITDNLKNLGYINNMLLDNNNEQTKHSVE